MKPFERCLCVAAFGLGLRATGAPGQDPRDCNLDGVVDPADCNWNSVPDECDVAIHLDFTQGFLQTPAHPPGLVAADLDGDGDLDLATANYGISFRTSGVSVFLNDGGGTFAEPATLGFPDGVFPSYIIAGDLDGDGDLDLALAGNGEVLKVINAGAGTFEAGERFSAGLGIKALAAGDLDGDGDLDLVTASSDSYELTILWNSGAGNFSAAPVGVGEDFRRPVAVHAADLDGDRDLDLLAGCTRVDSLKFLLNEGGGKFSPAAEFLFPAPPISIDSGDLDGDGDLDVAVTASTSFGAVSVLLNQGGGRFSAPIVVGFQPRLRDVRIGDMDGDGILDLAVLQTRMFFDTAGLFVYSGAGGAAFGLPRFFSLFSSAGIPSGLALGDIDGDGDVDMAIGSQHSGQADPSGIFLYRNQPDSDSPDCNSNGVPDECELFPNDCNRNRILDACDLAAGASLDRNRNGLPDECETDCNFNGVPDDADLAAGSSPDCDGNGIPDECDLEPTLAFASGRTLPLEFPAVAVASADFDGDRAPDIAAAYAGGTISLLLNRGAGIFQPAGRLDGPRFVGFLAAADLDGDGAPDLAAISSNRKGVSILLSRGDGGFLPDVHYTLWDGPSLDGPRGLTIGDIDGDRDLDLVVAVPHDGGSLMVLFNSGSGSFTAGLPFFPGSNPRSLDGADLDGDGDLDLVTLHSPAGSSSFIIIHRNRGDGTFAPESSQSLDIRGGSLMAADVDGDGAPDVVVSSPASSQAAVLLNRGGDLAFSGTFPAGVEFHSALLANLDNRSGPDLVLWGGTTVSVLLHAGGISFPGPVSYGMPHEIQDVSTGDLDGDGDLDLTLAGGIQPFSGSVLINNGAGRLEAPRSFSTAGDPRSLAAADLDGDGILDLATVNQESGTASLLFGSGGGSFARSLDVELGPEPGPLAAADLDGDRDLDLAAAHPRNDILSILLNQGDRKFIRAGEIPAGPRPIALITADLDGDGAVDLAAANRNSGTVSLFRNRGNGDFERLPEFPSGEYPVFLAAADLDGDDALDLVVAHQGRSRNLAIFLNVGGLKFAGAAEITDSYAYFPEFIAIGDVDRDGHPDLVVSHPYFVSINSNEGMGRFVEVERYPVDFQVRSLSLGDFDQDDDLDIVLLMVQSGPITIPPFEGTIQVFRNRGDGSFNSGSRFKVGASPFAMLTADLDADGKPDMAVADAFANSVLVVRNDSTPPAVIDADRNGVLDGCENRVTFRRGDIDQNGLHEITDPIRLLSQLFLDAREKALCRDAADINDDGQIDISDPIRIIGYLFLGDAEPPAPFAAGCGLDPTPDELGCHRFRPCEDGGAGR